MSVPPEEEDVRMSQTGMSWATCAARHCPDGHPEGGELFPEAGPEKPGLRLLSRGWGSVRGCFRWGWAACAPEKRLMGGFGAKLEGMETQLGTWAGDKGLWLGSGL